MHAKLGKAFQLPAFPHVFPTQGENTPLSVLRAEAEPQKGSHTLFLFGVQLLEATAQGHGWV